MAPLPLPLIQASELLRRHDEDAMPVMLDCSFDLARPDATVVNFEAGHLPGAYLAHLADDLSGPLSPQGPVHGGRHPLPALTDFAGRVTRWGIEPGRPVVVYDQQGSAFAARAWWLLKWLGHDAVAVLDGGAQAWRRAGGAWVQGPSAPLLPTGPAYPCRAPQMPTVEASALLASPHRYLVLDARAGERYRGEVEPLDTRAGHIPGARHRFFRDNLDANDGFRPAAELRAEFVALGVPPEQMVHQCGSGVTACHNLLAMAIAGLPGAALYPGSWSEWSADPLRPIATGA